MRAADHITSRKNQLFVHLRKLQTSRAYREETRQFCGDGVKLLDEAVRHCSGLHTVIACEDLELPDLPHRPFLLLLDLVDLVLFHIPEEGIDQFVFDGLEGRCHVIILYGHRLPSLRHNQIPFAYTLYPALLNFRLSSFSSVMLLRRSAYNSA